VINVELLVCLLQLLATRNELRIGHEAFAGRIEKLLPSFQHTSAMGLQSLFQAAHVVAYLRIQLQQRDEALLTKVEFLPDALQLAMKAYISADEAEFAAGNVTPAMLVHESPTC